MLLWNLGLDIPCPGDNFRFALFSNSRFNDFKRDTATTTAPRLGSYNLVFYKFRKSQFFTFIKGNKVFDL